jgi:DNA-3-methyladenine glycosylase I
MASENGVIRGPDGKDRCYWCDAADDYRAYHDGEWGRPVSDDIYLFEKICLDGFQSGLSWLTILRKRENFRRAFAGFDFHEVARFKDADVERLLADAGITAIAARSPRRSTTPAARLIW